MIAWLMSLGNFLEPIGHLARLPVVLLSHATLLIWGRILKKYLDEKQLALWLGLALLNPLFGLGGIIATPDIPLLFFWSVALLIFERYQETPTSGKAALLGAALGLGFCSKYHIVIFPLAILISLTVNKSWNSVRVKHVALCLCWGLIFSFPVLIWNLINNFDSFAFQLNHGLSKKSNVGTYPLEYLGGQFALIFPLIAIPAVAATKKDWKNLGLWAWLPIVFFLITSFKSRVEPNWPIMAYPALFALAVRGTNRKFLLNTTVALWFTAFLILFISIVLERPKELFYKTKLKELHSYDILKTLPNKYTPLYAGSYQMASAISYQSKKSVYKLNGMNRRDFYDYLELSKPDDDFYVVMRNDQVLPEWARENRYKVVEEMGSYQVFEVSQ